MSNLLGTIRSSAAALSALQQSVAVSQNNVNNASTPGYVRQSLSLAALAFDPNNGLAGGVDVRSITSSRDPYTEIAVRNQVSRHGQAEQSETSLSWVESAFDLNDTTGIASTLDRMFSSFTAWSLTPNSTSAKENVISAAGDVAASFNKTSGELERAAAEAQEQISTAVSNINSLAAKIRRFNEDRRTGAASDAGVDAELHVALEELSELVDFQALHQDDGTVTILVGGEAALVVGDQVYELRASFANVDPTPLHPDALPPAHIYDANGREVTAKLDSGRLTALLDFRNRTIPHYLGDTQNAGELNRLAQKVSDRVNSILAAGYPAPQEPYHLFIYGLSPTSVAHSVRVNPALGSALLSATSAPPASAVNGKALELAGLARPEASADKLDDLSLISFVGKLSARAGRDLAIAQQEEDSRRQLEAQAKNIRTELSGVSLDEEAVRLVEFQRAYQAAARVVTVLDELTQIAVNIGRA